MAAEQTECRFHKVLSGLFFVYAPSGDRVGAIAGSRGSWQAMPALGVDGWAAPFLGRFGSKQEAAETLLRVAT